jgi:hypothetical protein
LKLSFRCGRRGSGKFEQLVVSATSKYAGTDISVESPAAVLEVKAP